MLRVVTDRYGVFVVVPIVLFCSKMLNLLLLGNFMKLADFRVMDLIPALKKMLLETSRLLDAMLREKCDTDGPFLLEVCDVKVLNL